MRQHVKNVHEGFKYDCTSCDYKSGYKDKLNRHIHHKYFVITYTCELCHHVLILKEQLKHYVDIKHNGFTVDCEICSLKAGTKYLSEKNIHILLHHKKVSFDCHICQHIKNNCKDGLRD